MPNLRPALLLTLVFIGYLLWVEWQKDYGPRPPVPAVQSGITADPSVGALPGDLPTELPADLPPAVMAATPASGSTQDVPAAQTATPQSSPARIRVLTDVLELEIDLQGGTLAVARLLDYPEQLERPEQKVQLFSDTAGKVYLAQSGLLSQQAAPNHAALFTATNTEFQLEPGQDRLEVPLSWTDASGLEVTKVFELQRGAYDIQVWHRVRNGSEAAWTGGQYQQLQRAVPGEDDNDSGFNNPEKYSFNGLGFYSPEEKLQLLDFDELDDGDFQMSTTGGWLAMIQHYFFAAWIPPAAEAGTYSTQVFAPNGQARAIARVLLPAVRIEAGGSHEFLSTLYVGPKIQDHLADVAPGLDLTVNYGIFTVFSAPLFWLLSKIHDLVGNWGWAILLLTVLIKLAFFKLTETQYRSMARMRKLQPRIEKLKERYGSDRQRMSQAMMEMYKEEKVNPLGGCLPLLVQIPIFIALYWVLLESVELRQAPFILWIDNLSVRDPYFVLPLLNAVFMIITQRLTPTVGMDPLQAKMMQAMPIIFAVMFAFFPAGLVLYWATNAGLSLAQQWYITRKIAREP